MERLRLQVSVVAISDYERLQYDKDLLRRAYLDTVRSHIDRLAIDNSIITKSGSCKLSTNWVFLDSTTAERFFRIDKSQESLHYITDISSEDLYLLDPEFVLRTGGNELPTTLRQQQVVDDDTSPTKAELEISATGLKETQKELDDADYRCSRTNRRPPLKRRLRRSAAVSSVGDSASIDSLRAGLPDTSVTVQTDQQQPTTPPSPQPSVEVARQAGSILASRSALSKALIDACKRGCLDKMRALRDKGADLGAADSAGMTCLHHATRFGYRDIVAYLVEHGPPQLLDQADLEKGQTALHKASWYQRRQICQLLVQAGASLTVVDSAGLTPRQQAC
uniref:ANK_REP_REGION domain-containing protein n=1 Tax=Macrostomum lignano TaxID=282301 RepID=A0A1I8IIR0_9PLAT